MLMDFLKNLNWVDILMAVILARIVYIGIKTGFVIEFSKFWGVFFSIFVVMHFYTRLAVFLEPHTKGLEPTALRVLIFLGLWAMITFVFKLVRDGLTVLFTVQPHPIFDKWVGACVAVIRGLFICSLTFFVLLLSQNVTALKLCEKSWSKYVVSHLATNIYYSIYNGMVVKFFPLESLNQDALTVPQQIEPKKKK